MPSVYPSVLLAALVSLTACSALAHEQARIYVYAQRQSEAKPWIPVYCDGAMAAKLKRGTLFAITVPAGRHVLSLEHGVPATIDAASAVETYFRLDWHYHVGRAPIPVLSRVSPARAREEMKFLSYLESGKVISGNAAKTDPRSPAALKLETR